MYIIEKQAAYNIDENTEICSLSEDTVHAEILNWLNCTVDEWNAWYKRYAEGEFDIDIVLWCVLRQQLGNPTNLENLQDELQSFYAVVLPSGVEEIFEELVRHEGHKELLEIARDKVMLEMLIDLESALRDFFPNAPYIAVENILYRVME